jgi:release factor glutamine methyltransferase
MMETIYRPAEDSFLLAKLVKNLVQGRVLDMGTGSGIQAITAAKKPEVSKVLAVDINSNALDRAKKRSIDEGVFNKIDFILSDLFQNVKGKFDWIIFNPPYLPSEGKADEFSWSGGETGAVIIRRFLEKASKYLVRDGSILLIFSSETDLSEKKYGFKWELLEECSLFFETVFCVKLSKFETHC